MDGLHADTPHAACTQCSAVQGNDRCVLLRLPHSDTIARWLSALVDDSLC